MPLDAEARREISRRNGRQSAGPKTKEGKARSCRNALRHGLRAEVLALPHEDPDAIAARADAWFDYYRPEGPAAHHLVNQCVHATLLADRCQRQHAAALARQVRAADSDWLIEQEDALERLKRLLPDDPGAALLGLKRLGIGCRWLIERWERLRARLDEDRAWFADDCDEAIRLLGHRTGAEELKHCPDGFRVRLYNALCLTVPDERVLEWLCHPARMPEALQAQYSIDFLPDPENCPGLLRAMIDDQIAWLRPRAEWLETTIEGPDRAEAPLRATVLNDQGASRLFVRYHAESRAAFHRAFKELTRVLDADAEAAREDETEDSAAPEVESEPVPEPVPVPISPNEPELAPHVSPNEPELAPQETPSWLAARMLVSVLLAVLGLVLAGDTSPKSHVHNDLFAEDRPSQACRDVPANAAFPSIPGVSGHRGVLPW